MAFHFGISRSGDMHSHNETASAALSAGENMTLNISSERLMAFCDGECAVALLMIPAGAQIIVLKTNCANVNAIFIFFNRL